MKNKVLLLAAVLTLGISANSFAATAAGWIAQTGGVITLGTAPAALVIKPSANVSMAYNARANTATPAVIVAYTIGTKHSSGTFLYATSSTDTNIYRNGVLAENIPAAPADATAGVTWTNWSASK